MNAVRTLARRYAFAYLNLFSEDITIQDLDHLQKSKQFFVEHKRTLYFLSLPTIAREQKSSLVYVLLKKLVLPESLNALMELLIMHKKVMLWPDILSYIITFYEQKTNIMHVVIESSYELEKKQLQTIKQFLADKTGKDIIYEYHVNKELIAGVRARSDTLLWECSVAQKLRDIRLSLK